MWPRASASAWSCSGSPSARRCRSSPSSWSTAQPCWPRPQQLAGASVTAKVVGEEKGPKINAMTYKNKSNQRRRWGHRQHYATLEITAITAAG